MRRIRVIAIALAALVPIGVTVTASVAAAAPLTATPTGFQAPYDALTFNHVSSGGRLLAADTESYDDGDAVFGNQIYSTATNVFVDPADSSQGDELTLGVPVGGTLSPGTYTTTNTYGSTTLPYFTFGLASTGVCTTSATIKILDIAFDPTSHGISNFALSYVYNCPDGSTESGDLRFRDNVALTAALLSPKSGDDGTQYLGSVRTHDVTFTDTGTTDLNLGNMSLAAGSNAAYSISADTCSGVTLHSGDTCDITVTVNISSLVTLTASLVIDDAPQLNPITLPLTVTGIAVPTVTATPGPGQITLTWTPLAYTGDLFYYQIYRGTSPANLTLIEGFDSYPSFVDTTPSAAVVYYYSVDAVARGGTGPQTAPIEMETWPRGGAGTYVPMAPSRILDTRTSTGGHKGAVKAGQTITVTAAGIPYNATYKINDGEAAVINLTATGATAGTYLTVWPYGQPRPTASSINVRAGLTRANLVTVALGSARRFNVYVSAGSVNVIADLVGYYTTATAVNDGNTGGLYHSYFPAGRLFDTRTSKLGALPGGYYETLTLGNFPATFRQNVTAIAVNITAVGAKAPGYLTTWDPDLSDLPPTSTLNFQTSAAVPNMTIIRTNQVFTGSAENPYTPPKIAIYNGSSKPVQFVIDIQGYYDSDQLPYGARLLPITPKRLVDSRLGLGLPHALGSAQAGVIDPGTIVDYYSVALDLNVTGVAPTAPSNYLTLWPDGVSRPGTSNLNEVTGQVSANQVFVPLGEDNKFEIYNSAGTTNVVADLSGVFELYPYLSSGAPAQPNTTTGQPAVAASAPSAPSAPAVATRAQVG